MPGAEPKASGGMGRTIFIAVSLLVGLALGAVAGLVVRERSLRSAEQQVRATRTQLTELQEQAETARVQADGTAKSLNEIEGKLALAFEELEAARTTIEALRRQLADAGKEGQPGEEAAAPPAVAAPHADPVRRLTEGMTPAQVVQVLGQPERTLSGGGTGKALEIWNYADGAELHFAGGALGHWRRRAPPARREEEGAGAAQEPDKPSPVQRTAQTAAITGSRTVSLPVAPAHWRSLFWFPSRGNEQWLPRAEWQMLNQTESRDVLLKNDRYDRQAVWVHPTTMRGDFVVQAIVELRKGEATVVLSSVENEGGRDQRMEAPIPPERPCTVVFGRTGDKCEVYIDGRPAEVRPGPWGGAHGLSGRFAFMLGGHAELVVGGVSIRAVQTAGAGASG